MEELGRQVGGVTLPDDMSQGYDSVPPSHRGHIHALDTSNISPDCGILINLP